MRLENNVDLHVNNFVFTLNYLVTVGLQILMRRNVRKRTFRHVRPGRFRSACAFAQSDQNLPGRISESHGCTVSLCGQRRLCECAVFLVRWTHMSEGTSDVATQILSMS